MGWLAHDEGRRANAHANEERKRVLPDGIVPSDANLLVELVDNETSDVFVGISELFTIWSCEEHVVVLVHLEPLLQIAAKKAESASRVVCRKVCVPSMSLNNYQELLCRRVTTTENEIPITRLQNTSKERHGLYNPLCNFPVGSHGHVVEGRDCECRKGQVHQVSKRNVWHVNDARTSSNRGIERCGRCRSNEVFHTTPSCVGTLEEDPHL